MLKTISHDLNMESDLSVKNYDSKLKIGLANDGDSDRFGVVDENGNFISANDVLLLAAYHLNKHKGYNNGNPIIRSAATSSQLDLLADKLGLKVIVTPTGFKYIGEEMIELEKQGIKPIICGEESGGLTIGGHIPEKDGFLATLLMAELMAYEKKPIGKILRHIKEDIIGTVVENSCTNYATPDKFAFIGEFKQIFDDVVRGNRNSVFGMKVDAEKMKSEFAQMCKFKKGGDGVKIFFENGSSVLVRLSGTEDKARVYKEVYSKSPEEAVQIKNAIEIGVGKIAEANGAQAL